MGKKKNWNLSQTPFWNYTWLKFNLLQELPVTWRPCNICCVLLFHLFSSWSWSPAWPSSSWTQQKCIWFIRAQLVGIVLDFFPLLPLPPRYRPSFLCLCRQSGPALGRAVWGWRCSPLVAGPPGACLTETSWSAQVPVAPTAASEWRKAG